MPLPILGALVVFGIGGVVLLVHLLRMSRREGFADEEAARAVFAADYPAVRIDGASLSDDRVVAILNCDAGAGLAAKFGAGALTRLLARGDVRRCEEKGEALHLVLADFAAPRIIYRCADPEGRSAIKALLEART